MTRIHPQPHVRVDDRTANDRALDALVALFELGRGRFTLAFVSYERPGHRDWIIPRLRFRLPGWSVAEVSLVDPALARPPSAEGLFAAVERAAARSVGGRPIDAVLLTDWEKVIDFDLPDGAQPASALMGAFNMGRGLFKQTFACPVVVFVTDRALVTLLELAPDFASWQSGSFAFAAGPGVYRAELEEALRCAVVATGPDRPVVARWLDAVLSDLDRVDGDGVPRRLIAEARAGLGELSIELGRKAQALAAFGRLRGAWAPRWWARAWSGARRAARLPEEARPEADPWAAFRGAAAFKEGDELFGRDDDLKRLIEFLTRAGYRCGTIWGETGSGKTSLVRARTGLLASLRQWGFVPVLVNAYGPDPERDIRSAVARAAGLPGEPSLEEAVRAAGTADRPVFVLCDQFELVFMMPALRSRKQREPFLKVLAGWINDVTLPVRFLLIIRADRLFHLSELDQFVPFFRQLDKENYHELLWLSVPDALKVLHRIRAASRADWTEELMTELVDDLAEADGRVRPVEIQLLATVIYVRGIETPETYAEAGRKKRLLTEYLNAIFDNFPDPTLARLIGCKLVDPSNPLVRPCRTAKQISGEAEIRGSEAEVGEILRQLADRFHVVQRPEAWERTEGAPESYQLVHDVLIEPALVASTAQEIGLGIVRPALARRRRFLSPRELMAVLRIELKDLPPAQLRSAKRLIQRTRWLLGGLTVAVVSLILFAGLWITQSAFVHIRTQEYPPHSLVFRRGLRRLDILPWPLAADPVLDTGFISVNLASARRLATIEDMTFSTRDYQGLQTTRGLLDHLERDITGRWRCYIGDWQEGLRILCDVVAKGTDGDHSRLYQRIERFRQYDPEAVREALYSLLGPQENAPVRAVAATWFMVYGADDPSAIPRLCPLLDETALAPSSGLGWSWESRHLATVGDVAAVSLIRISRANPERVIAALTGVIDDRSGSASARAAAARTLAGVGLLLPYRSLEKLSEIFVRTKRDRPTPDRSKTDSLEWYGEIPWSRAFKDKTLYDKITHYMNVINEERRSKGEPFVELDPAELNTDRAGAIQRLGRLLGVPDSGIQPVDFAELPGGDGIRAIASLIKALDDKDAQVRLACIQALGMLEGKRAIATLVERLDDKDAQVRLACVQALGSVDGFRAHLEQRLVTLLNDLDSKVRLEATKLLNVASPASIKAAEGRLMALLHQDNPTERVAMAEAVCQTPRVLSPSLMTELVKLLGETTRVDRSYPSSSSGKKVGDAVGEMLVSVATVHPAPVITALTDVLDGTQTSATTRIAAIKTLEQFSFASDSSSASSEQVDFALDASSVSKLTSLLRKETPQVRAAATRALGRIATTEFDQVVASSYLKLMKMLVDRTPQVRETADKALDRTAATEIHQVTEKLIGLLADHVALVRAAATSSLDDIIPELRTEEMIEGVLWLSIVTRDLVLSGFSMWTGVGRFEILSAFQRMCLDRDQLERIQGRLPALMRDSDPSVRAATARAVERSRFADLATVSELAGLLAAEARQIPRSPAPAIPTGSFGERAAVDVGATATEALARIGAERPDVVVPTLASLLQDHRARGPARAAAAHILGRINADLDRDLVAKLEQLLHDRGIVPREDRFRSSSLREIADFLGRRDLHVKTFSRQPAWAALLDSDHGLAARKLAKLLGIDPSGLPVGGLRGSGAGWKAQAVGALVLALKDDNVEVRVAAAMVLVQIGAMGTKGVEGSLVAFLDDRDPLVRAGMAYNLGQDATPAVDALVKLLADQTRISKVQLPGHSEDFDDDLGWRAGSGETISVAEIAATTLERIGAKHPDVVLPKILNLLSDHSAPVRIRTVAASILGTITDKIERDSVNKLARLLSDRGILASVEREPDFGSLHPLVEILRARDLRVKQRSERPGWAEMLESDPAQAILELEELHGIDANDLPAGRLLGGGAGWRTELVGALIKSTNDGPAETHREMRRTVVQVFRAMDAVGMREVKDYLVGILAESDPQVRADAAGALALARPTEVPMVDALAERLYDNAAIDGPDSSPRRTVSDAAVSALLSLGRESPKLVVRVLLDFFDIIKPGSTTDVARGRLAAELAPIIADPGVSETDFDRFWQRTSESESNELREAAVVAQSQRLLCADRVKRAGKSDSDFLMDKLKSDKSKTDALYRRSIVAALTKVKSRKPDKAGKVQGELLSAKSLDELKELAVNGRSAWLRVAAWQVLTGDPLHANTK